MTATQKRHRRWVLTGTFLVSLTVSSAICGVYRSAHADPAARTVPVVMLPSAQSAVMPAMVPVRVLGVPSSAPIPEPSLTPPPDDRLLVQAPELLPLPLPLPEKAPPPRSIPLSVAPPEVKLVPPAVPVPLAQPDTKPVPPTVPLTVPDVKPIENPMPVVPTPALPAFPAPLALPLVPPLTQPLQSEKPADSVKLPPAVQPEFRLQPPESRHNVKSAEPSNSKDTLPLPVSVPPALPTPQTTPGDPPMMPMSFRRTALSALVGTALVTGTMFADNDPPKGDPTATKKDLDQTNQRIADLKKELADLKTTDLVDLKQQLTAIKAKDLADFQKDVAALRTKDLADLKKDVEALRKTDLADMKKDVEALRKTDLADIKKDLESLKDIKKDLESLKDFKKRTVDALEGTADRGAGGDGLIKKITALDDKLTALNKQLESLDKKLESTRTALASPVAKEPEKEKPKVGSVKLVNMYATDVEIVVNGKGYRVAPNESKTLTLAVGSFTYQLLTGGGAEKTRSLKDGEEVTLMVNN
ncbi:hypothetical protein [Limnoglobus roseus]|uniref:Uncharacterized protein n=1 Tax=Limnoglobus roseus TaxID=2598579 RepID=A0A5C1A4A9_9BACT|nr:hypothetical protein [Limnoglobus roseus]QEL13941.1 hypothetical protein PX52LOC_00801 [Limnoglobus roseus]